MTRKQYFTPVPDREGDLGLEVPAALWEKDIRRAGMETCRSRSAKGSNEGASVPAPNLGGTTKRIALSSLDFGMRALFFYHGANLPGSPQLSSPDSRVQESGNAQVPA